MHQGFTDLHMPSSTNPLRARPDDGGDVVCELPQGPSELHWLLSVQLFPILPVHEAERVLIRCLVDMTAIISEVFAAELEAVMNPSRELTHVLLCEGVHALVTVLKSLPETSFVGEDGVTPDPQFHNVVRGLCHLWTSSDTKQLSSVMRHISITRPAAAVSQVAQSRHIRLPARERWARELSSTVSTSRLVVTFYLVLVLLVIGVIASVAGLLDVLNNTAAIAISSVTGVGGLVVFAYLFFTFKSNRDASDALVRAMRKSTSAGVLRFVMPTESEEPTSLGSKAISIVNNTNGNLSATRRGSPAVVVDPSPMSQDGGESAGLRGHGNPNAPPASIRYRYPHGVLMLPQQNLSNSSDTVSGKVTDWICIDARAVSRSAIIVGLDTDRNITMWNSAAVEGTGFVASEAIGQKALERLACKGDTLFRLPRIVGEMTPVALTTLASGKLSCDAVVADLRMYAGDVTGYAFICPAVKENNRQALTYLHEYHWHELTNRAQMLEFSAKQLRDCVKGGGSPTVHQEPEMPPSVDTEEGFITMSPDAAQRKNASPKGAERSGSTPRIPSQPANLGDIALVANTILRQTTSLRAELRQVSWDSLNAMARAVASEWEWTNGERLLGAAAKYHFSKASICVDSSLPVSFRLPPSAARVTKAILNMAPAHCTVSLTHSKLSPRVGRITAEIRLDFESASRAVPNFERQSTDRRFSLGLGRQSVNLDNLRVFSTIQAKFDTDRLLKEVMKDAADACATVHVTADDTIVHVNFPCVRDVNNDTSLDDDESPPINAILPTVATKCDCVVAVCLEQPVEQQNLGMLLLGVKGVSLSLCRDVKELAQRLRTIDIVIIANSYRDLVEVNDDIAAVVIPVVDQHTPFAGEQSHIKLPFQREAVLELLVAASEVVAENKRLQREAREREEVLTARNDAPWTKGAILGKGSFGTVYVAVNELTGGKMAVKQFDYSGRTEALEAAMESLMNEIRILTKLDHPNIVHYLYCERTSTGINLFMELCDTSLASVIPLRRRFGDTFRRAVPVIMHQTLLAVAYLHTLNVVHRDIKPQNMLIKGDKIKLTDFGTAHQAVNGEQLKDTQGTFRFMAPEVFQAKSYNQSCDTWSIGCVLCELLDVRMPFMQPGQHYMLADLKQSDVSLAHAHHLTEDEREFILVCLQVQKEFRPPISTLLMHPFVQNLPSASVIAALLREPPEVVGGDDDSADKPPPYGSEVDDGDGFTLVSNS